VNCVGARSIVRAKPHAVTEKAGGLLGQASDRGIFAGDRKEHPVDRPSDVRAICSLSGFVS
jgi:hypothetical protein